MPTNLGKHQKLHRSWRHPIFTNVFQGGYGVWHIYIFSISNLHQYTYSKIQNDVLFFHGIKSKHPFWPKLAPWKLHRLPRGNRQPRPVRPAGVRWLPDAQSIESEERRLCWHGRGNWELHKTEKLTWIYTKSWFRKGDSLWNMAFFWLDS